jgi:hypothetical protein
VAQQTNISAGCSKRPFSKAAASEEARRTLRYVEPLSDARSLQGKRRVSARLGWAGEKSDFFNILLGACPAEPTCSGYERAVISRYGVVRGRKLVICRLLIYYPLILEEWIL